jgi:hypothetical protein
VNFEMARRFNTNKRRKIQLSRVFTKEVLRAVYDQDTTKLVDRQLQT